MHLEIAAVANEQRIRGAVACHAIGERIAYRMGNSVQDIIDIIDSFYAALPFTSTVINLLKLF